MRGYLLAVLASIAIAAGLFVGSGGTTSASLTVIVSPGDLVAPNAADGWYFWNDKDDIATGSPGSLVSGPAIPPLGTGSVRLGPLTDNGATAAGHSVIATNRYYGTNLADITALSYSTYQPGPTLAIAIQFDVRYRTSDTAYGGRLVFEPYQNGAVTVGAGWQSWSPLSGIWWASKTTAAGTGGAQVVALPAGNCAQSSPCTWAQINAAFPAAQIYGRFLLKAGSNWTGFDGNADNLTVGVNGVDRTYDFEAVAPVTTVVTASSMTSTGWVFYDDNTDTVDPTLGSFVTGPGTPAAGTGSAQISVIGTQRRNLATYQFAGTTLSDILAFRFRTYNPSAGNPGSPDRSAYLHFNVDFNGSDTWQRRLVFVPSQNGTVVQNLWQEWDAISGGAALWLYSGPTWPGGAVPGTTAKTWSQILSDYPGVRVRVTDAFVGLRVGEPYTDGYTENIDTFTFGTAAGTTIFNFEDTPACTTDCYVDGTTGNDAFDGSTATSAKKTIQAAINAVSPGGTVHVAAGTYNEDVAANKTGVQIVGAGIGASTIVGPIGGGGSTIQVTAGGVVVDGFTITRAGNNPTDWNAALNTAGVAVQSQGNTVELRNSKITGMRTGVDINNSNGNSIHNNIIDNNRTGMILRNQTDNTSVVNNFITNNWTIGVLFLDASGGTNSPVQSAINSTFRKNNISGNWYGQVEDRQSGGSLPAPGTNKKNFEANWWGTTTPVTSVVEGGEPGYAAQIPVAFGGAATPPGGQPDIKGSASANIVYSPWLGIGTDGSVATGFQLASPMDWIVGPTVCGATCIQAAIDFSSNGDTVKVKTGVFAEHVIVNKDVTVTQASLPIIDGGGTGDVVTITATGATLDGFEIRNGVNGVVVTGANNVTVINNQIHTFTSAGFRSTTATGANYSTNTITGPHTASCVGGFWGMLTTDTSGQITNNIVSGIGNGLLSGCQEGRAIEVTGSGTLQITGNNVSQYQKSGIITRGTVAATISGNTTTGEGATSAIAMNGITITSTGNTSISNNTTSNHRYIPESDFSCGVLYAPFGPTTNAATISTTNSTDDETAVCLTNAYAGGTVSGVQVLNNIITKHHQRGIDVDGMTSVVVDGNTIDGQAGGTTANPGTDPDTDSRYYGVFAVDSTGTVSNNIIKGITHGPSNGTQSGVGIRVSARSGQSANMTLSGNIISDIQKGGIVVLNPYGGTSVNANVTNNTVTGNGPINYIAQNGIQISNGATATVSGNDVSGYDYTPSTYAAIGILVYGAGATSVTNNIVHDLMEGMFVQSTDNVIVTGNSFTNYRDTAIFVYLSNSGTYGSNTFSGNKPLSVGMWFYDASTNNSVQTSSIRNNDIGVVVEYSAVAPTGNTFSQNCIANNTSWGMQVLPTQTGGPVNAENNWWGKVNGPNPPGNGDKIDSASTIDAIPFLTAPVAGCPVPADGDGDGLNDPVDNCPTVFNPSQANTNAEVMPLPKPIPAWNDATNPAGDFVGDACDPDIDGDGVPNGTETTMGLSPYSWDTDGDRTNDGTEIACGSDPLSAASNLSGPDSDNDRLPDACEAIYGSNPAMPDTDGDKVLDGVEVRYWLTDPTNTNSDGDECTDGREVATINGDRVVNPGDQAILSSKIGQPTAQFRPYDQNGDGVFNVGDQAFMANRIGSCP